MKRSIAHFSFSGAEFLFRDAVRLLKMSKKNGTKTKDVHDLKIRGSYARASILLFDFSIEAILIKLSLEERCV